VSTDLDAPTTEATAVHPRELGSALDPGLSDVLRRAALAAAVPPRRRGLAGLRDDLAGWASLRHTEHGIVPILMIGLVGLVQVFDDQAYSLAGPLLVKLGVSVGQLLSVLTYVGLTGLIVGLGVAYYADRGPRVWILGIGTVLSGIAGSFTGVGTTTTSVGLARSFDSGLASAADTPIFSLAADYYAPEVRVRAFSLLNALRRSGEIFALPVVALLLVSLGVRTFFVAMGALLVATGLLVLLVLREPARGRLERLGLGASEAEASRIEEPESFGEAWRSVFAVRTVRRLFAGDLAYSVVQTALAVQIFWLADHYHLSILQIALSTLPGLLVTLVAGAYGSSVVDRILQRSPARAMAIFGFFLSLQSVALVVRGLEPPLWVVLLATILSGIGLAMTGPTVSSINTQVIPPTSRTLKLQMTNLANLPSFLFVLPVQGIILAKYGYGTVFLVAAPFAVIAGGLYATAGAFFAVDRRNAVAATMAADEHRRSVTAGRAKQLVCRSVDVAYDGVQVLFGVDFDVDEGEIVALLGTNGAGKSTLLRAISGAQQASGGAVVFEGRDITAMPAHETATRGVVFMPGGRGTFPALSVRENLLLGCYRRDDGADTAEAIAEVLEIFPALAGRLDDAAGLLSGGEQQQLSLALAFLVKPKLLMIDELSLGLSPVIVGQLIERVKEINRRGVTVIVVEQSVNVALQLADRAVFMEKGEVRFSGSTAELMKRPDVLRAVYVKGTGGLTSGPVRPRGERHATTVLEVSGLAKAFGGNQVLADLSFSLSQGESLGVIGPNGSGKTTMFDIVSGFLSADAGSVVLKGVDVTALGPERRAAQGLVRRFQDARLFPSLTVFETLLVSLEGKLEVTNTVVTALGLPQARRAEGRIRARADRILDLLELGAFRDTFVRELSTGLRRVVDLACVLALEPEVLLLDEPSSGISQSEAEGLAPLLRRVQRETGCSMLIIEHDIPLISAVADELIALADGQVLLRGTPSVVLDDERVIASYLGSSTAAVNRSGSVA
jgi:ABC-type branched-subunit amino acid transport system ATPase component/sugar phosphate permease